MSFAMVTCIRECTCPSIKNSSPLAFGKFPGKWSSIFIIDVVCFKETYLH